MTSETLGKVIEMFGKLSVGERCWVDGKPHKVARILGRTYWDSDRIDDLDEFGREPGWYTELVAEPDALTEEESVRIASEEAELAARRDAAEADGHDYRERMAAMKATHSGLIAGLVPADSANLSVLHGLALEVVGRACEPGRGCTGVTELSVYRDASGATRAVTFGCPYDLGPSYWIDPALAVESADKTRVWGWWNPEGYHADSYPGPGVAREELTPAERSEVDRLEAARMAAIREKEGRSLWISALGRLVDAGLAAPEGKYLMKEVRKPGPFRAISWWLEFGPEFEGYLADYAAHQRRRKGDYPMVRGLTIRLILPVEAFTKKGRKPAPAAGLPAIMRLHNFADAAVVYETL